MVHQYLWDYGHGLTIQVNFMIKCIYVGLGSSGFVISPTITKWLVTIRHISLVVWATQGRT